MLGVHKLMCGYYWTTIDPPPPHQTCCCRTCVNSLANFGFNMVGGPGTELTDSLGLLLKKVFWVQIQFNAFGSTTLDKNTVIMQVTEKGNQCWVGTCKLFTGFLIPSDPTPQYFRLSYVYLHPCKIIKQKMYGVQ